tara:strand:- start:206 stop:793 length:588 start_codon:yes stop_codon:yes gene_type:complete
MTKEELIEFIKIILNLDTTPSYIYLDVSNSLDNIKDYEMFIKEFKSLYSTLKLQLEYKTAFQKFLIIMEVFNNQRYALTHKENDNVEKWRNALYSKVTWYFDELSWLNPTEEQLINQVWQNHQNKGKNMFSIKELQVCNLIGETKELYRLTTKNKPLLMEKIKSITLDLIKQNKSGTVAIGYENNPVAKLMNKGK